MADPYKYYRIEARELVDHLTQGVLALDGGAGGRDLVASLLRLAHTLKGASRVVKQTRIADLAHRMEGVLTPFRDRDEPVPGGRTAELLGLTAQIGSLVTAMDEPGPGAAPPSAAVRAWEEPSESLRLEAGEVEALMRTVSEAGVQLAGMRRELETLARARRLALSIAGHTPATPSGLASQQNLLGGQLAGLLGQLERSLEAGAVRAEAELSKASDHLRRLRLAPAALIFPPLARATADASMTLGRQATLGCSGGETRLDARVASGLRTALLHLVRNAVAHGIEPPEERVARGKAAMGRVEVSIERSSGGIRCACQDDGRGLDLEGIRQRAIDAGLLPPGTAVLGLPEAVRLLLRGGFSTGSLTGISGRGIGLDAVRAVAEQLGASVEVESSAGKGAVFRLCVPTAVSSLPGLWVEAGGATVLLPLSAVRGALTLQDSELQRGAGVHFAREGHAVPFLPLARALNRPDAAEPRRRHLAVVIGHDGAVAAVGVDRVMGISQLLVRALPPALGGSGEVAGAVLDAEGNPQLVLDPAGLIAAARECPAEPPRRSGARRPLLVIDDSLTTRMLEQSILEAAGYEVELACSAEEALVKAAQRAYGAFLVDVEMPGMDGFEFLARVRDDVRLRDVPALLVTSRSGADDRRRGEELGARGHIVKSDFDQGYFLQTLGGLVAQP